MRRGPDGGYGFGRKKDYRRKVWATFREELRRRGVVIANAHAVLMPSLEGEEIDVALNNGFREEHLHIIDDNPAIVATLKRRYPRINTYGVPVRRAGKEIARRGFTITCANLDMCSQVSQTFCKELTDFTASGCLADEMWVAATVLRGRENRQFQAKQSEYKESISSAQLDEFSDRLGLSERDVLRAIQIGAQSATARDPWRQVYRSKHVRTETYKSTNGQTMLWSLWHHMRIQQPLCVKPQLSLDELKALFSATERALAMPPGWGYDLLTGVSFYKGEA